MAIERNLLSTDNFRISFGSIEKLKNAEIYAVGLSLPGFSIGEVSTSFLNENGYVPGDTVEYETLSVTFAVDENLKVYKELHSWIIHNSQNDTRLVEDITIQLLSSHLNSVLDFKFIDSFPTSVDAIELNTRQADDNYTTFTSTFRYDKFLID